MEAKKGIPQIVHYIITAAIIFGFGYLPTFGQMTPWGMQVLGTFIGAIYGWRFLGMIWPSMLAITALGMYSGMYDVLGAAFANPIICMMFVYMPLMAVLEELGVTTWIIQKLCNNPLTKGRPWVAIFLIFMASYMAAWINSILAAFIMSVMVISMCKKAGVAPFTKLSTVLLLGVAYAIMNGQPAIPFLGSGLTFIGAYSMMFGTSLPFGQYIIFFLPLSIIMVVVFMLVMRFVFRVDVSPLAELSNEEVPKLTKDQKKAIGFFLASVLLFTVAFMFPQDWGFIIFLNEITLWGMAVALTAVMMLFKKEDGTPLLDFEAMASKGMSWSIILMTAYIMTISNYLTAEGTGITETIMALLEPMTHLSPLVFIALAMLFITIVTNLANNMILTIMLMPVIGTFALQVGIDPIGVTLLTFLMAQMAMATPAASPIVGVMYAQDSFVKPKDLMKYALIAIPILFVVALVLGVSYMFIVF